MKTIFSLFFYTLFLFADTFTQPQFRTTYLHSQPGTITVENIHKQTHIIIKNKSGIGKAKITLLRGIWQKTSLLQLYLNGLEGISISNEIQSLHKENLHITQIKTDEVTYFNIVIPASLLYKQKEITFTWVDFYR